MCIAPASWSAWQWVIIITSIKLGGIPILAKALEEKGGGSIIIPLWLIHKIQPEVDPQESNPWEDPSIVTPKTGGVKYSLID